jgi:hypothetical protein
MLYIGARYLPENTVLPAVWFKTMSYLSHHYGIHGEMKKSSNGGAVNFIFQPLYTRKITPVPNDKDGWAPESV